MKKMNINLKEEIIKYKAPEKIKDIANKMLELIQEGKNEENIKTNIDREITNLVVEEGEDDEVNINRNE